MNGAGKYDEICTKVREETKSNGVILMIIDGQHGSGFSIQAPGMVLLQLPGLLRFLADEVELDIKNSLMTDENPDTQKTEEPAS